MRILFISDFYPPNVIGGWEQLVRDINQRLQARGHVTRVLTSTYGPNALNQEQGVDRLLTLESDLYHYDPLKTLRHKAQLKRNLKQTLETISIFQPDVVFIHGMWNLTRGVAWQAEQLRPGRVVYYVANDWPYAIDVHTSYWRDSAGKPVLKQAKKWLALIPLKIAERENRNFHLRFEHVLCVSQAVKDDLVRNAGIPPEHLRVVYNGVETDAFVPPQEWDNRRDRHPNLSLLYAGSLVPHKGVHTAIEAMAVLAQKSDLDAVTLTIVGSGHPEYEARLKKLVDEEKLGRRVSFWGRVSREEMPTVFQKFDVLIFPSIWQEPLARTTQEAMASGMAVIGTLTGGTGELLIDGETGLAFEPEDAAALAQRIEQLQRDPGLFMKLAKNGRARVLRHFDIRRMIDEIEACLSSVAQNKIRLDDDS
jgi:glycogen(starch) synthase